MSGNDDSENRLTSSRESRLEDASKFWQRPKGHDLKYEKSLSHHIGARNWENHKFYAYGIKHIELYEQALRFFDNIGSDNLSNILEWGPGGGANALAFCRTLKCKYIGVDISQENLNETSRVINSHDLDNFNGFQIDIHNPEAIFDKVPTNSLDLFLCTAVFPHLPDKEYARRIIDIASKLLKVGGVCILHILNVDEIKSEYGDYNKDVHRNTVFTYEEALQSQIDAGLTNLYCVRDDVASYSYYFSRK
jgi:predicted O-methyltransferase YrrM